jgi:branched-chain amino acid aminotransferase
LSVVETLVFEAGRLLEVKSDASLVAASARLPSGAYTSLRTYHGSRILRLAQHVARLQESLRLQGLAGTVSRIEVQSALAAALRSCGHAESRVRLTAAPPRLFVSVEAFQPLPAAWYKDGVSCVTLRLERGNPHAKDTGFIATSGAVYRELPPEVNEGLLLGPDREILEGLSSNFFAVVKGTLRTEPDRVLLGVTRSLVLELTSGLLPVSLAPVQAIDLASLEEAFLTSVSRGVLPVRDIDGAAVGSGEPGPVTAELKRRFEALAEREAKSVFEA